MGKKRICLDPGHYGSKYNKGAVSGYYESAIVWKLTYMEKEILEKMGIEVIVTRTNITKDIDLVARGKKAEGCDLFVSNHTNACDDASVRRVVGIYLMDNNKTTIDEKSKEFAGKLAKVVKDTMGVDSYRTYSRKASSDRDKDGKKNDNYYGVLHGGFLAGVPSIIMEHSFHTNAATCKWLMDENNLRKLAEACAKCMAEFVGVKPQVATPSAKPATVTNKVDSAHHKLELLRGKYKVTANSGLHIRTGAGTNNDSLGVLKKGTVVRNYGWYNTDKSGKKWLYVAVSDDFTGYCHIDYLQKC